MDSTTETAAPPSYPFSTKTEITSAMDSTTETAPSPSSPFSENIEVISPKGIGRKGRGLGAFKISGDPNMPVQKLIEEAARASDELSEEGHAKGLIVVKEEGEPKRSGRTTLEESRTTAQQIAKEQEVPVKKVTMQQILEARNK